MNIASILASKGSEVRTIKPDTRIADAMRQMREQRISSLVISEDGARMAGIISDRGILQAITDRGVGVLEEPISSIMATEVVTCSREDAVSSIMALMTRRRIRHIPVVEADGRMCGLVSIGDVVKHHVDEIQREAEALREYISGVA